MQFSELTSQPLKPQVHDALPFGEGGDRSWQQQPWKKISRLRFHGPALDKSFFSLLLALSLCTCWLRKKDLETDVFWSQGTNHRQFMASLCFLACRSLWRYTKRTNFGEKPDSKSITGESSAKSETTSFFDLRTSETVWPEPRGCHGLASHVLLANNHLTE